MAKKKENPAEGEPTAATKATAATGLPRVIDPSDRAPQDGSAKRFKVRCTNYEPRTALYILAEDEASARECYLAEKGIAGEIQRLKESGAEKIEPPQLTVTVLPD